MKKSYMILDNINVNKVKQSLKISAFFDELICEKGWFRCFEYKRNWKYNIDLAKYDNGGGDYFFTLFYEDSAIIKGFDHESEISPYFNEENRVWPGIYQNVPEKLLNILRDDSLKKDEVTFCYWRSESDQIWNQGPVEFLNDEYDGTELLLEQIFITPEDYIDWAKDYYEEDFKKISTDLIFEKYNIK